MFMALRTRRLGSGLPTPAVCSMRQETAEEGGPGTQGVEDGPEAAEGDSWSQVCVSLLFGRFLTSSFSPSLLLTVAHEHLKERGLFGLPAPGANASDYYHQMTLMAGHPTPYGDLLMQSGGAASAPHLHDYLNPVDSECWARVGAGSKSGTEEGAYCSFGAGGLGFTPVPVMTAVHGDMIRLNHRHKFSVSHHRPGSEVGIADTAGNKTDLSASMELTA